MRRPFCFWGAENQTVQPLGKGCTAKSCPPPFGDEDGRGKTEVDRCENTINRRDLTALQSTGYDINQRHTGRL